MNLRVVALGLLLCCAALQLSGCSRRRVHASNPVQAPADSLLGETTGYASWYGHPYHGRRTSNGEIYDMNTMSAAHRTLPFDTVVKVNNLSNGKTVAVRINDRGPFVKDRVIDLSYRAAKEIDMVGTGTTRVSLEVLKTVPSPFPLAVQAGSFREEANAKKLQADLQRNFSPVSIQEFQSPAGTFYRVLAGQFKDAQEAQAALQTLRTRGLDGFIVRLSR
ncbi:MAG: septal ring lytic transglycosylase RlpA family protein [Acidimicrobiia bacterium]|nr:septal ring lytic transglycosylase RlpA family protein [Acidimicrobiia bacterium]